MIKREDKNGVVLPKLQEQRGVYDGLYRFCTQTDELIQILESNWHHLPNEAQKQIQKVISSLEKAYLSTRVVESGMVTINDIYNEAEEIAYSMSWTPELLVSTLKDSGALDSQETLNQVFHAVDRSCEAEELGRYVSQIANGNFSDAVSHAKEQGILPSEESNNDFDMS